MADHAHDYRDEFEVIDPSQPFTNEQREYFEKELRNSEEEGYERGYSLEEARQKLKARLK